METKKVKKVPKKEVEEKPLTLRQVAQKFKISPRRRSFSTGILRKLRTSREKKIREGEVYCMSYRFSELPTDKWHIVSLVLVTEISRNFVRGYNLLYLPANVVINVLERLETVKSFRKSVLPQLMNEELGVLPYSCTRKDFLIDGISSFVQVPRSDWGMVPIMDKVQFGNLNSYYLIEDWKIENMTAPRITRKPKKKVSPDKGKTFVVEEDQDGMELVFDEEIGNNLMGLTGGMESLDDFDI